MSGHVYNCKLRALTHQALASILLSQSSSHSSSRSMRMSWWKLHGRCCTGPSNGYPGSTTYTKTCLVTLLPGIWKASVFYSITMVRQFIQSERTRDWSLHLETTRKRLHLFNTAGHLHYAALAHLYHQKKQRTGWIWTRINSTHAHVEHIRHGLVIKWIQICGKYSM